MRRHPVPEQHGVRVLQGVYRPASAPLTHALARRGAALVVPVRARLTGRSLATVCGAPLAGAADRVDVVVPHGVELRRAGVLTPREHRAAGPAHLVGVRTAHAHRMAFDLAARWDLPTGVAHLDAVVAAGLLDRAAFAAWLEQRHDDDVRRVRRACELVDPRAGSLPVPELRVAIEDDGAWHALRSQLSRDRERLNAMQAAGWTVVHVTADMLRDPAAVVAAVRAALASAASRR